MKTGTNKPLVSIITPFLNLEIYITEAIESVLAQSYENWELILVDDGSTDKSSDIAKEYALKYSDRVQYVEHENHQNKGISASRNLGFQHSKGTLIAFLDADDIYLPHKLEDQVSILLKEPRAGMLYAATEYWHSWTGKPEDAKKDRVWDEFGVEPNKLFEPPELLGVFLRNSGAVPCMGSLLVRREVIQDIGGWENSFHDIYEDQILYAKIALKWPIFVASECWDKYRQHPDSICHVIEKMGKANFARRTYLSWLGKYLYAQGVKRNTKLWRALRHAIDPSRHTFMDDINLLKNKVLGKISKYKKIVKTIQGRHL